MKFRFVVPSVLATTTVLLLLLLLDSHKATAASSSKCSFLSAEEGPPFEMELPASVLSSPLLELPIEFRGVTPILTRGQLKHGALPKLTIERYSNQKPNVYYDEELNRVIVSSTAKCGGDEEAGGAMTGGDGAVAGSRGGLQKNYVMLGATALLMATTSSSPLVASAAALVGTSLLASHVMTVVQAHPDDCQPVVQLMVQAPSAYKGAVETCLDEINDGAICPDPFPTYLTCHDATPICKVAVVGAGAGGLYTALRYVCMLRFGNYVSMILYSVRLIFAVSIYLSFCFVLTC
jgi:hypothetical protein